MDNRKEVKTILFDLGNTLIYFDGSWEDTLEKSYLSLTDALIHRGIDVDRDSFPAVFKSRMSQYFAEREDTLIEQTTESVLKSLLVELEIRSGRREDVRYALDAMYRITESCWRLEVDTIPLLEYLFRKGYQLGLVSNAADSRDVDRLIDEFQLRDYFSEILISASVGIRKPHPQIFNQVLSGLSPVPEETMMVGGTLNADVLGASKMGIQSVLITRRVDSTGAYDTSEQIQPDYVIDNLLDLIDILEQPTSV